MQQYDLSKGYVDCKKIRKMEARDLKFGVKKLVQNALIFLLATTSLHFQHYSTDIAIYFTNLLDLNFCILMLNFLWCVGLKLYQD